MSSCLVTVVPVTVLLMEASETGLGEASRAGRAGKRRPGDRFMMMVRSSEASMPRSRGGERGLRSIAPVTAPLRPGYSPRRLAGELFDVLMSEYPEALFADAPRIHPTGFIEGDADGVEIQLVYTAAFPVSVMDLLPPDGFAWVPVHQPSPLDRCRDLVRDYWRERLAGTTAARELLPRYFTMSQLHDAYNGVWNRDDEFEWGNFKRWAEKTNDVLVIAQKGKLEKGDPRPVTLATRQALDSTLTRPAWPFAFTLAELFPEAGGTSLQIRDEHRGSKSEWLTDEAAGTVARIAGSVAYRGIQKGRRPDWFEWARRVQRSEEAVRLKQAWAPQPNW